MKILVFTEGALFIGASVVNLSREQRIQAVKDRMARQQAGEDVPPVNFRAMVPAGNAVEKLWTWKRQGAEVVYLTSRTRPDEVEDVRYVLGKFGFPEGELYFRREGEQYRDVAVRVLPDVLVEDDCESIGGEVEMTYPHIRREIRGRIKSVVVPEAGGIDHLPDDLEELRGPVMADLPPIPCVGVILENARGQVLLLLRDDRPDLSFANCWSLPGGVVEEGETPEQAALRELREEIGREVPLQEWKVYPRSSVRGWSIEQHILVGQLDCPAAELVRGEGQELRFFGREEIEGVEIGFGFKELLREYFAGQPI